MKFNKRHRDLPPLFVRPAGDAARLNFWVRLEDRLDFTGEDILPRDDEHFFDSPCDGQISLVIQLPHVSGMEPTILVENFCGFFGHPVVPPHHVWPTQLHLAVLSGREDFTGWGDDTGLDFRKSLPNRAQPRSPWEGDVGGRTCFGQAVPFMDLDAKPIKKLSVTWGILLQQDMNELSPRVLRLREVH